MNFSSDKPTQSAMYLVDRGMQGRYYRYYNADSDQWGMCGADMDEAFTNKDKTTAVGFFPWVGPLTGPNYKVDKPVVVEMKVAKVKTPKPVKVASVTKAVKVKVAKTAKAQHPDGTVFFREDRQKWVAIWAGKQEAARPTPEACLKFLKKKYNHDGVVIAK